MKTFFLLSVVASAALAAPAFPNNDIPQEELPQIETKRERKAASFGQGIVGTPSVTFVPTGGLGFGGGNLGQFGHGLHRPFLHNQQFFRDSDKNEDEGSPLEKTEEFKRDAEVQQGKKKMSKNLDQAKEAVENLERDLKAIEGETHIHKHWSKTDLGSDESLHKNIENARLALEHARKSFDKLEMKVQTAVIKDAASIPSTDLRENEEERMAQWKTHIKSIQGKHVEDEMKEASQSKTEQKLEMETSASNVLKTIAKSDSHAEEKPESKMQEMQWSHGVQQKSIMVTADQLARESLAELNHDISMVKANEDKLLRLEKAMRADNEKDLSEKKEQVHKQMDDKKDKFLGQSTGTFQGEQRNMMDHDFQPQQRKMIDHAVQAQQRKIIDFKPQQRKINQDIAVDSTIAVKAAEEHKKFDNKQTLHVPKPITHESGKSSLPNIQADSTPSTSINHNTKMHIGMNAKSAEADSDPLFSQGFDVPMMGGPSMRSMMEKKMEWKELQTNENARNAYGGYGASAGIGSGLGLGAGSAAGAGAGAAGSVVGVFPGAHAGGCALPILLSCSPQVVHGSLKQQAYGASSYGGAAYRSVDEASMLKKRNIEKFSEAKSLKKRANYDYVSQPKAIYRRH